MTTTNDHVQAAARAIDALWSKDDARPYPFESTEPVYQKHCIETARAALEAASRATPADPALDPAIETLTREKSALEERRDWYKNCNDSAHAFVRYALDLPDDAPRRHDFYASKIDELKARAEAAEKLVADAAEVIRPFAEFSDPNQRAPKNMPITHGSIMAKRQLEMGDCYAARAWTDKHNKPQPD